jgi:SHS2 domain-containing protein
MKAMGIVYRRVRKYDKMKFMYETFDHTADLGLRIRATDRNALFAEAARALFATLVENLDAIAPAQRLDVNLTADDCEYLLFDWLKELLYHFDTEHLLFSRFEVSVGADGLHGSAWGEPFDPARHELAHEVKAITYHGLRIEETADGWLAEVIVDI